MAALQCDICGGSLTMAEGGEFAVCDSCGMKHDKRRVQQKVQEIRGSVKIEGPVSVEGVHNADKLAENAETFLSIGELEDANQVFAKLASEYPADFRGWWGQARLLNLDRFVFDAMMNKREVTMPECYVRAIKFAPTEKKIEIECHYKECSAKSERFSSALVRTYNDLETSKDTRTRLNNEYASIKANFSMGWLWAAVISVIVLIFALNVDKSYISNLYDAGGVFNVIVYTAPISVPTIAVMLIFVMRTMFFFKNTSRKDEIKSKIEKVEADIRMTSAKYQEGLTTMNTDGLLPLHLYWSK